MTDTRKLFAEHSLRCTRQRMAVYESLRAGRSRPTADELFRIVKPHTDRLSLATVYNALDALVAVGLVRRLPTVNGCCRYGAGDAADLHVSVRGTSELLDVPADLGARLLAALPADAMRDIGTRLGVRIDGVSIQLHARRQPDSA